MSKALADAMRCIARLRPRDPSDARVLKLYFQRGGLAVFTTSTFGSQLERAAMFAYGGQTCRKCRGTGCVASTRKWRKATAEQQRMTEWEGRAQRRSGLVPPALDRICGECHGMGWTARTRRVSSRRPLTARMTGSSKRGRSGGVEIQDVDLAALATVEARLRRVGEVSLDYYDALREYYTNEPATLSALYPLVPAGIKLLRRNPLKLPALQLLANIVDEQKKRPDPNTGVLLANAEKQAFELHEDACKIWTATRRSGPETIQRKAEELLSIGGAE